MQTYKIKSDEFRRKSENLGWDPTAAPGSFRNPIGFGGRPVGEDMFWHPKHPKYKEYKQAMDSAFSDPEMTGGQIASKNPYGFIRQPNKIGFKAVVHWYNPTTGETWTAPDTSWRPPNDQWMSRNFPRMSPGAQKPAPIKSQPAPSPTMPGQPSFGPNTMRWGGNLTGEQIDLIKKARLERKRSL